MGNRRFAQIATSSDEEDDAPLSGCVTGNQNQNQNQNQSKRTKIQIPEEENKKQKKNEESEPELETPGEDEEEDIVGKPVGEVVTVSGKGRERRKHYASFEYDGLQYHLEDSVLLVPEEGKHKPYVAIIKDITQTQEGLMMVMTQWFYRPEDIEKTGCGNWQPSDNRELFYSFHKDESPAESVMHKCVVHFIPQNKQYPHRKEHPGFIVQRVYDTIRKRLYNLTDKDYEDNNQNEVDLLVQKTLALIGELPDLEEPEDATMDFEDEIKNKHLSRKRNMSPLDASRNIDEGLCRSQSLKAENPRSTAGSVTEHYAILSKFNLLTGETHRDKWLEKLLQSVQFIGAPVGNKVNDVKEPGVSDGSNPANGSQDKIPSGDAAFDWPDAAVPAVAALEKAAHDTFSSDFQKYNQKMRQLAYNLKGNAVLARRLLNKELEPARILNMSPNELKEGLTAEEIASREPEESGHRQMTDARCKRCNEKQVALIDVIQAGRGDRYQLECVACGNTWYASRDDASTLSIEGPSSGKTVGTAPLATAKFEDIEKNLVSPRGADDSNDNLKHLFLN